MLREELQKHKNEVYHNDRDILFPDYIKRWLEMQKPNIAQITYEGYSLHVKHPVAYFEAKELTLGELQPSHFEEFYNEMLTSGKVNRRTGEKSRLSVRTVREFKFIINAALNKAVANEIIPNTRALNIQPTRARSS
ncbi:MAG: phage integrase SAM-like domain-containing protein [Lachnospiraceae bacterium]|nr:phage integrase SAM-like domain-containing protein [Lachnospiraceae bacterium]